MKAYQVSQFGEPIEPHMLPDRKQAGRKVLIDVVSCGLCHSDVHFHRDHVDIGGSATMPVSALGIELPATLGHEIVSKIAATVPNEGTSECLTEESPPLAPELDSGTRANPRLIAGNKPNNTDASGPVRGGLPPRVLRRVREYIDANLRQRISVEALARLADLSVWYFVRAFKKSVGLTPHNYLIRRRVERTLELLSETELSLSEIALAAGFADHSHLTRRFRQHVGMSPRQYRWLMS